MKPQIIVCAAFTGTYVAAVLLFAGLDMYFDKRTASASLISLVIAAMIAGQVFARRFGAAPAGWTATLYAMGFGTCIAVVSAAQVWLLPGDVVPGGGPVVLLAAVLTFVIARFAFPWAARMDLRRRAAR